MSEQAGPELDGPSWLLILRGRTLPYVWRIPAVVGCLLTAVNQGPHLPDGLHLGAMLAIVVNFLTPYVVSSLGFLAYRRALVDASKNDERVRSDRSGTASEPRAAV